MTETNHDVQQAQGGISPAIVLFLITGLLGLLAAGVMLLAENDSESAAEALAELTAPRVINDWQAPDLPALALDGEEVRLSDYSGRTIFLNFWWTGCTYCVREMPAFMEFIRQQGEDGALVLTVNQGEDVEEVEAFLTEIGVPNLPTLLDRERIWGDEYGITGFPTTYVIDGEGMVRYMKLGEITLDDMYTYLDALETGELPAQG